ncbi:MAG: histidine kinase [Bacteroidales bacterium]
MSHPITGSRRSILIYVLIWLIVAILYGVLSWYYLGLDLVYLVVDSLISTLLYGFLGLLIWYPTRYIPFSRQNPLYSVFAHVMAGVLFLATWLLISVGLLSTLFPSRESYLDYLNGSLTIRAILGGIIYLVLVLVYYLASYSVKLAERAKQEERLQGLVRDAELNMLKSQINPHFLFNSLNSIASLTMSNPSEARDMIIRLSDFLRYSLKHRENEYVPLKEELGRMKDYLAIEKVRFGEKLHYAFEITLDCEQEPVPTMILQPLFENAIRHSVYESTDPVHILFQCSCDPGFMSAVLINDYDPDVPSRRGTGVGLQNVRQRIELAYEGKGSVHWQIKDRTFEVRISFPRNKTTP